MQHALTDLRLISGVMGSFIMAPKRGIVACDVPGVLKQDKLNQAGRLVSRIVGAGKTGFANMRDMVLNYSEMFIFIRLLKDGAILVIMGDPTMNINLLAMSLNLAQEDFDTLLAAAPSTPVAATPTAGSAAPSAAAQSPQQSAAAGGPLSLEQLNAHHELAPAFEELRHNLAKVMGPMASIIFDDALLRWAASHPVNTSGLLNLVEVVCIEIGDLSLADQYRNITKDIAAKWTVD